MNKAERQERESEWIEREKKEAELEDKFSDLVQQWFGQSSYDSWWLDDAIHNFIAYICLDKGYEINERNSNDKQRS